MSTFVTLGAILRVQKDQLVHAFSQGAQVGCCRCCRARAVPSSRQGRLGSLRSSAERHPSTAVLEAMEQMDGHTAPLATGWGRTSNRGSRGLAGPSYHPSPPMPLHPAAHNHYNGEPAYRGNAASPGGSESDWQEGDGSSADDGLSQDSDYGGAGPSRGGGRKQSRGASGGPSRITATLQMGGPRHGADYQAPGTSHQHADNGRRLKINFRQQ